MIHVLSGKGITNVAGVIRVSYPANSTLVITGGSSGKQFAKDTNTTSSAKAYIFLAPIGDASYTLTATNTAGKTVSKKVYVAKDQVQSVVLVYKLYIFKSGSGLTSGYSVNGTGGTVSKNSISWSGSSSDGGISVYINPAVVLKNYTKLCVDFECSYNYGGNYGMGFGVGRDAASDTMITNTNWTAKVTSTAQGTIARNTVQCDISALTDSEYIKIVGSYSAGKVYNIWLE